VKEREVVGGGRERGREKAGLKAKLYINLIKMKLLIW
jgi:hypothetical protein